MSSEKSIFVRLKDPPKDYDNLVPLYCSIFNHHHVILFKSDFTILYDLDQQKITKKYDHPNNFYYDARSSCVDHQNNILYIVDRDSIISLDMIQNKWSFSTPECTNDTINTNPKEISNFGFVTPKHFNKCHFISYPMNELHVMTKYDHFTYNKSEDTITNLQNRMKISRNRNMFEIEDTFIYRKRAQQLLMYRTPYLRYDGDVGNKIFICDANMEDLSWSKWRRYDKTFPKNFRGLKGFIDRDQIYGGTDLILAFDQILFCFGVSSFWSVNKLTVWCLDLDCDGEWHRATLDRDFCLKDEAKLNIIKDDDNYVHLMSFDEGNRSHFKSSLAEIIPNKIMNVNKQKCNSICIGYMEDFERSIETIFIPMYLKKIIITYCPIFL